MKVKNNASILFHLSHRTLIRDTDRAGNYGRAAFLAEMEAPPTSQTIHYLTQGGLEYLIALAVRGGAE